MTLDPKDNNILKQKVSGKLYDNRETKLTNSVDLPLEVR